jgi:hypothetical protein
MGSYELRDLDHLGVGSLYEGKLVIDKSWGHGYYGCAGCCGYGRAVLNPNPLSGGIGTGAYNISDALDGCSDTWDDVTDETYNWASANPGIVSISNAYSHFSSPGSTGGRGNVQLQGDIARRDCPVMTYEPQNTQDAKPFVGVTPGPTTILAFASGATNPQNTCVNITASSSPSGGSFSWTTSSSTVALTNTTNATVTVCSVADQYSNAVGDVSVMVSYTAGGQSASATTTLTVLEPVSLTTTNDNANNTGHTCVSGSGTNSCSTSYYSDSPNVSYASYVKTREYSVNSNLGSTISLNMNLSESYTGAPNVTTGAGIGSTVTDCFYYCAQACRLGKTSSISGTQTITANGFTVATKSVTWACGGASVTP